MVQQILWHMKGEGTYMDKTGTDVLTELEKRLDNYLYSSMGAEKIALEKLEAYPQQESPSPLEILRRERLRHRTQTLLLKEIKSWLSELTQQSSDES